VGLAGRDGSNLAVKEINEAGGVRGRKLRLIFEDDGNSPTRALAAAKKLLEQDQVFAIFSIGGSNPTSGTLDYVKEKGAVMYVSFASAPRVTLPFDKHLFRGGTTESARYGELYAELIVDHHKAKKIAILSGRDEYTKNEGDFLTRQLKEVHGVTPVVRSELNIGDKDFTPQLLQIQQANPDLVAVLGYPNEVIIALRQARELGLNQPFFVSAATVEDSVAKIAGRAAEGISGFMLLPHMPTSDHPSMLEWLAKWKKEYPSAPAGRPNLFDVLSYNDMYAFAEGLRNAGPEPTTEKLIAGLEKLNGYRAGPIANPITFTNKHHVGNLRMQAKIVKNGAWQNIEWESKRDSAILKRYE
jgi:branched-chain amino acid transport system substrate-binding protein